MPFQPNHYSSYPHMMLHAHLGHFCTLISPSPITSIYDFTSVLDALRASTSCPWDFPKRSKRQPISIVLWLIRVINKQIKTVYRIRVDENSTLDRSSEFLKIFFELDITIETTRGCISSSNYKVECLMRDLHKSTRIALTMSGLPVALWYFARQNSSYVRR